MESVGRDFAQRLMTSYSYRINNPRYLVNMDETAVHMNCSPNRTIHEKGEKTVSIMIGGASSARFTLPVSVGIDGAYLPLFVIFKGKPEVTVEKQLPGTVPDGIVACVQRKAWMDDRTMRIWYDRVCKQHISNCQRQSGLLLDDFVCHKSQYLKDKMKVTIRSCI